MTDRRDHVVDAIDSTLHDYEVSVDAMRYVPEEDAERRDLLQPREGIVGIVHVEGENVIRTGPDSFLLPGNAVSIGPLNADPLGEGWVDVGHYVDDDAVRGAAELYRQAQEVEPWADHMAALRRPAMVEFVLDPEALARINDSLRLVTDAYAEVSVQAGRAAKRLHETLLAHGIVQPPPEPSSSDPRERALQARQSRNTGPERNPHRRRGRG